MPVPATLDWRPLGCTPSSESWLDWTEWKRCCKALGYKFAWSLIIFLPLCSILSSCPTNTLQMQGVFWRFARTWSTGKWVKYILSPEWPKTIQKLNSKRHDQLTSSASMLVMSQWHVTSSCDTWCRQKLRILDFHIGRWMMKSSNLFIFPKLTDEAWVTYLHSCEQLCAAVAGNAICVSWGPALGYVWFLHRSRCFVTFVTRLT